MSRRARDEVVLSIYPTKHGLAYTLFDAPLTPIDWGLKRIEDKCKNARSLAIVEALCQALKPDTLVIEDSVFSPSRRQARIRRLLDLISTYAETENLTLVRYSKKRVKCTFRHAGAITRYEIAQAIATYVPALAGRLPPVRKLWQSEDHRLALFDAAALALTHFAVVPDESEPP